MQQDIPYSLLLGNAPSVASRPSSPLFRGRYLLLEEVGHGTFSAVYRAEDTQNGGRILAIKRFQPEHLPSALRAAGHQCFFQEAQLLKFIRHPQIPVMYDSDPFFLALSFLPGQTLERFLSQVPQGVVPFHQAIEIGRGLCMVLSYLHTHRPPIKFRDLNPGNVMLTPDGRVFLIDFGAALPFVEGQTDAFPLGVVGYAPREQYSSKWAAPASNLASDVYSLGAILHQMFSGEDPRCQAVRFHFSSLAYRIPPALADLIARMLANEWRERPSIQQVEMELTAFAR
jgi:serine/threonine protein kinase